MFDVSEQIYTHCLNGVDCYIIFILFVNSLHFLKYICRNSTVTVSCISTETCQNLVSSFEVVNRSAGSFTFDSMNIKFLFTCNEIHIQLSFTCIIIMIWLVYLWQY